MREAVWCQTVQENERGGEIINKAVLEGLHIDELLLASVNCIELDRKDMFSENQLFCFVATY